MSDLTKDFWEDIYKQNISKMIGICYRYTQDRQTAEDLAQDAFLVAIDKSSGFANRGSFEAWLRRIVVNVALQHLRKQKKLNTIDESAAYNTIYNDIPEEDLHDDNAFSEPELLKTISLLPEHHRLVFNLYVIDNFSHAQIGAALGISEGTSKSHLARARKKVRELLNNRLKEEKGRKKAFLLLLPFKLRNIDRLFAKTLSRSAIQPHNIFSLSTVNFSNVSIPKYKPLTIFSKIFYLKAGIAALTVATGLTVVSTLHFNSYEASQDPAILPTVTKYHLMEDPKNNKVDKFSGSISATFSKNVILTKETKSPKKMGKAHMLGALLVTSLAANAQKLPNVQEKSLRAPATVKIDGKRPEWDNLLQAYNKATGIFYTISNDNDKLYLVAEITDVDMPIRLLAQALRLQLIVQVKRKMRVG